LVLDKTIDSTLVAQHPNLKVLEQQKKVSLASTKLEKSKLLPSLRLSYNNTSITGTGANDVIYDIIDTTEQNYSFYHLEVMGVRVCVCVCVCHGKLFIYQDK
jgi:outer membrane protein TolC